jgi:biopolymer transport protein ExbD
MQFKQRRGSQPGSPNFIPMLDVLMGVLTVFALVSIAFTQQDTPVQLSAKDSSTQIDFEPEVAVVKLAADGNLSFGDQPIAADNLMAEVEAFRQKYPKGFILLQADKTVPHEQVVALLHELKQVDGNQVSLDNSIANRKTESL